MKYDSIEEKLKLISLSPSLFVCTVFIYVIYIYDILFTHQDDYNYWFLVPSISFQQDLKVSPPCFLGTHGNRKPQGGTAIARFDGAGGSGTPRLWRFWLCAVRGYETKSIRSMVMIRK